MLMAQQANDDLNAIVEDVMKWADKPENGGWQREIMKELKSVRKWHEQIEKLCDDLGKQIYEHGNPDVKKLEDVEKLVGEYNK